MNDTDNPRHDDTSDTGIPAHLVVPGTSRTPDRGRVWDQDDYARRLARRTTFERRAGQRGKEGPA